MRAPAVSLPYWEDGAGFFGVKYMEGDDSFEGFLEAPHSLSMRTSREVDGVERLLAVAPGARILDCPCGYGRHATALAQRGFEVVGSDINAEMLDAARRLGAGTPNLRLAKENMLELDYREVFDGVINMFLAFGFFDREEDNRRVLANFFAALRPGGRFLLHTDVNVGRITRGKYRFTERRRLRSGRMLDIAERFDAVSKRLHGTWTLVDPDGRRDELPPYSCRVYTPAEISELCRAVGFDAVEVYGGWNGEPITDEAEEMIVVATRGGA